MSIKIEELNNLKLIETARAVRNQPILDSIIVIDELLRVLADRLEEAELIELAREGSFEIFPGGLQGIQT